MVFSTVGSESTLLEEVVGATSAALKNEFEDVVIPLTIVHVTSAVEDEVDAKEAEVDCFLFGDDAFCWRPGCWVHECLVLLDMPTS